MTELSSQFQPNPFIAHFLAGLPGEVAATFSADQLRAVQRAFGMRYTQRHAIDLRRSMWLPGGKVYLVLLAGRERPGDAPPPRRSPPCVPIAALVSLALSVLLLL